MAQRLIAGLSVLALAACQTETAAPRPSGAEDFAMLCSPCHGASGSGDGELAAELTQKPADLTGLAARNGGVFPTGPVMAQIWGYAEGTKGDVAGRVMPDFGALLASDTVLFDAGDGISTPTPSRLVELALYLKTLQN